MIEILALIGLLLVGMTGYTVFVVNLTIWVYERRLYTVDLEDLDEIERLERMVQE